MDSGSHYTGLDYTILSFIKVEMGFPSLPRRWVWHPHLIMLYEWLWDERYASKLRTTLETWYALMLSYVGRYCNVRSSKNYAMLCHTIQRWRWHPHLFKKVDLASPSRYTIPCYTTLSCTLLEVASPSFQECGFGISILLYYIIRYYAILHSPLQEWRWHPHLFQEGRLGYTILSFTNV